MKRWLSVIFGLLAASALGHAAETTDALFDIPLHPIRTAQNLARGIESTFANFGAGFGSGNFEKAGEAGFGIALMLLPELRLGKLADVGEAGNVVRAAKTAVGASDDLASLYRFVSPAEFESIARTGQFKFAPGGMEAKQFGFDMQEVLKLSDHFPDAAAIVRAQVPRSTLRGFPACCIADFQVGYPRFPRQLLPCQLDNPTT